MKGNRAAVRYAKSLLLLTKKEGQLDEVLVDVKMISTLIDESKDLELLLESPLVKINKKRSVLNAIFEGKVNAITMNFINLIVTHKREGILNLILSKFITQYNEANKIGTVNVSTAIALNAELKAALIEKIKTTFKYSEVQLHEEVDETLIGGLLLRIGDKQLDGSIRRQLNDIEKELVHTK